MTATLPEVLDLKSRNFIFEPVADGIRITCQKTFHIFVSFHHKCEQLDKPGVKH
jgi:hypothetical protein